MSANTTSIDDFAAGPAGATPPPTCPPTRPAGRCLRFCLGAVLLLLVVPFFTAAGPRWLGVTLGWAAAFVLFYSALHLAIDRLVPNLNRWVGATLAFAPLVVVFVNAGAPGQVGVQTFLGASLVLAALRADSGCEVMSIPGLIFGRRTHLMCLLFSPLDWVEARLSRSATS